MLIIQVYFLMRATTSSKDAAAREVPYRYRAPKNGPFWAYRTVLGPTAAILVLLGPSGAYWTIFYGPKRVHHSTVPVAGFSRASCSC